LFARIELAQSSIALRSRPYRRWFFRRTLLTAVAEATEVTDAAKWGALGRNGCPFHLKVQRETREINACEKSGWASTRFTFARCHVDGLLVYNYSH